jgi:hypothetical protein
MTVTGVHFYMSVFEDVTTTLSVNFGHLALRRTETSIIPLRKPKNKPRCLCFPLSLFETLTDVEGNTLGSCSGLKCAGFVE